jgi:hypothetical protein
VLNKNARSLIAPAIMTFILPLRLEQLVTLNSVGNRIALLVP